MFYSWTPNPHPSSFLYIAKRSSKYKISLFPTRPTEPSHHTQLKTKIHATGAQSTTVVFSPASPAPLLAPTSLVCLQDDSEPAKWHSCMDFTLLAVSCSPSLPLIALSSEVTDLCLFIISTFTPKSSPCFSRPCVGKLSTKDPMGDILGFEGHVVYITTAQLSCGSERMASTCKQMSMGVSQ